MNSTLYTIVPEETLQAMFDTFFACMDLPIQAIDDTGQFLAHGGKTTTFCNCLQHHLPDYDSCDKMHISASKKAITLGEPYVFACHADLNHIVFPLISNKTFLASILIGPFLMDEPDSLLIANITKKYKLTTSEALDLYDESGTIPIIAPAKVNHISSLLYFMFSDLISGSKEVLKHNNQKLLQQSKINESIQRYKSEDVCADAYPYDREKELINQVKFGDIKKANAILNDLLGYVLFSEGNSLDIIKARALELCSLLSRATIESGAPTDTILKLNNQFIKNLQQITTLDSLCLKLQEIVETFSESIFNYIPSKNNEVIKRAMVYISQHFNETLTLEAVSSHVHLHPSYFSTIFKQSTGSSFKEYLNMVRIEEGKRLLSNTDFSIIDIAVAIGFEDQSYFSKVFKKYTGITPKQFR